MKIKGLPFIPPNDFKPEPQITLPGKVFNEQHRPIVACLDGFLELLLVQPEAKHIMKATDFLNGYRIDGLF